MDELNPFEIAGLINRHITKTLTPGEESRLQELLATDPRVSRMLAEYDEPAGISTRLAYLDNLNVESALQKVKAQIQPPTATTRLLPRVLKYAAVLVICAAAVMWYYLSRPVNGKADQQPMVTAIIERDKVSITMSDGTVQYLENKTSGFTESDGTSISVRDNHITYVAGSNQPGNLVNRLYVPAGKVFHLQLADGSVVWLNNQSELVFPVSVKNGSERHVTLKGEAYFDVTHDPARPFRVDVNGAALTVLGTRFNVHAFRPGTTAVTLLQGSVKIANNQAEKILEPGQQAISDSTRIRVAPADLEKAVAWKEGDFLFRNDGIGTILDELARWYNLSVRIGKSVPPDLHYSGLISRSEKLPDVLDMLGEITGFRYTLSGNTLYVDAK